MATTTTATAALSMKLLIDRKAQRVLFAEASKDVVDFLFSLLATAAKLVGKDAMVGCVGNLYASVDKLDSTNVLTGAAKGALLCPTVTTSPAATTNNSSLLRLSQAPSFVQGTSTYTVTDDLTVAPSPTSAISSITLLNTFAVRDIGDLQEKTVQLGYDEGLAILKASLQSKSVLSDVFLHGNDDGSSSSGYQDGLAGAPVARERRARKRSSLVFGQDWSKNS